MHSENEGLSEVISIAGSSRVPEVLSDLSDERREELKGVLTFDSGKVESHLAGKVRQAVEDVLNDLLDVEADERCGAKRYVRSPDRQGNGRRGRPGSGRRTRNGWEKSPGSLA